MSCSIWCSPDQGPQSSLPNFHSIFPFITSKHRSSVALANFAILLNSSLHSLHCLSKEGIFFLSAENTDHQGSYRPN